MYYVLEIGITIIVTLLATYLVFYIYCTDSCEKGGRRINWVRNLIVWRYWKEYFPIRLDKVNGVELEVGKNYLFCCFPHGIFSIGAFTAFATNVGAFNNLFPHHTPYLLILRLAFYIPALREFFIASGCCSATPESINSILGSPEGGKVAVLIPGGVAETINSQIGQYKLTLKNRKGFVKLALKNGAPLVPVFSFGEVDIYGQITFQEGSFIYKIQEAVKKIFGIPLVFPLGRTIPYFKYGFLPIRKPITTLVGRPIDVENIDDPSPEQIDALHEKFIQELTKLFEEHKHIYIENWKSTFLEFV